jgi:hypothetical protein
MSRFVPERINEWAYWIAEREKVRKAKASGKRPPYTTDQIIASTRWCNVRRMDDKVSLWLLNEWYAGGGNLRYAEPRTALIAALLARMINRPETLAAITGGKPFIKWDYARAYKAMYKIKDAGVVVFTNAYIINGASGGPKIDQVLNAIDKCYSLCDKNASRFIVPDSMRETAMRLHDLPGVGSFIAGQVVADLRWVLGTTDEWWTDRMDWAPPGPGSSRGMKYLLGDATPQDMAGRGKDLTERQFIPALRELIEVAQRHKTVGPIFRERKLEAHDIQNTLCETGKYIRIKYGAGRGKNQYDAMARWQMDLDI